MAWTGIAAPLGLGAVHRVSGQQGRLDGPVLPRHLPDAGARFLAGAGRLHPLSLRPGGHRHGADRRPPRRPLGGGSRDAAVPAALGRHAPALSARLVAAGDHRRHSGARDAHRRLPPGRHGVSRRDRRTVAPQGGLRRLSAGDQPRHGDRSGDRRPARDDLLPIPVPGRRRDVARRGRGVRRLAPARARSPPRPERASRRRPACASPRPPTPIPGSSSFWRACSRSPWSSSSTSLPCPSSS